MSKSAIARLAKEYGGFFYQGAWRFPSVHLKDEFMKAWDQENKPAGTLSDFRCAKCKARLYVGQTCHKCGSDEAEEITSA